MDPFTGDAGTYLLYVIFIHWYDLNDIAVSILDTVTFTWIHVQLTGF